MMKRNWKRIIAVLVVCLLTVGTVPALAKAGDILDTLAGAQLLEGTPTRYQFLRNNAEGTVTKQINESGFYQRLPRNTMICRTCGNVAVELIPEYYSAPTSGSYTLSDSSVIGDCSFSLEYSEFAGYTNYPCLQFNYTAKNPGTTTVTLTYYYNYNYAGEVGYCNSCGTLLSLPASTTWYQETTTFTVVVPGDDSSSSSSEESSSDSSSEESSSDSSSEDSSSDSSSEESSSDSSSEESTSASESKSESGSKSYSYRDSSSKDSASQSQSKSSSSSKDIPDTGAVSGTGATIALAGLSAVMVAALAVVGKKYKK